MKLQEHISQLPIHSVDTHLWDAIDEQLSTPTPLVDRLPHHKADADIWFSIASILEKSSSRRFFRLRNLSIAASIAVIMTLGSIYIVHSNQKPVYYTEDIYFNDMPTDAAVFQDIDILENCHAYPNVCSTPDFTHLKSSLDQLKLEEQKLRDLQKSTNDPKIQLYHSRIVKDIQQVEAQLIQMFI